ncbi:MAG TPA: hypothetical protein VGX75_07580 [bacterium]|nr:hypothetical protein [bacterium]
MHQTSTVYIDPDTGTLSASPLAGTEDIQGIIPGVTGPIALRCSLHGRYHQVGTVTTALSGRSGLDALEDFIRVTLAAVCTTCPEWKQVWHQTSVAFDHLRADTHQNVLARPVETMLAVGRALNTLRPFPEALQALVGFQLPVDPPPLPLGGAFAVDPAGAILSLPPGQRPPAGGAQLPRDKSWCLVCCQRHGWEHIASLAEPDGRGRAALVDLGSVLIAQAVGTCDEYTVTREVLRRELEALPVRDRGEARARPARPLAAMRFYQDAAAAFTRATGDIGYVVARALEVLARTHFCHPNCPYPVDIVADRPFIGEVPVYDFAEISTPSGNVRVLHLEDAIADRIAAFLYWSDSQGLDVAERSAIAARDRLASERVDASLRKLDTALPDAAQRMNLARERLRRAVAGT